MLSGAASTRGWQAEKQEQRAFAARWDKQQGAAKAINKQCCGNVMLGWQLAVAASWAPRRRGRRKGWQSSALEGRSENWRLAGSSQRGQAANRVPARELGMEIRSRPVRGQALVCVWDGSQSCNLGRAQDAAVGPNPGPHRAAACAG